MEVAVPSNQFCEPVQLDSKTVLQAGNDLWKELSKNIRNNQIVIYPQNTRLLVPADEEEAIMVISLFKEVKKWIVDYKPSDLKAAVLPVLPLLPQDYQLIEVYFMAVANDAGYFLFRQANVKPVKHLSEYETFKVFNNTFPSMVITEVIVHCAGNKQSFTVGDKSEKHFQSIYHLFNYFKNTLPANAVDYTVAVLGISFAFQNLHIPLEFSIIGQQVSQTPDRMNVLSLHPNFDWGFSDKYPPLQPGVKFTCKAALRILKQVIIALAYFDNKVTGGQYVLTYSSIRLNGNTMKLATGVPATLYERCLFSKPKNKEMPVNMWQCGCLFYALITGCMPWSVNKQFDVVCVWPDTIRRKIESKGKLFFPDEVSSENPNESTLLQFLTDGGTESKPWYYEVLALPILVTAELSDEYLQHIKFLEKEIDIDGIPHRRHQSDLYWLLEQLETKIEKLDSEFYQFSFPDQLIKLGFEPDVATAYAELIGDMQIYQPILYWATQLLTLINDSVDHLIHFCSYPYCVNNVDVLTSITSIEGSSDWTCQPGNIINLDTKNIQNGRQKQIVDKMCLFFSHDYFSTPKFYHATTHKNASHIIENGIYLEKGSQRQDFSDGKGFYLSTELIYAIDWADRKRKSKTDPPNGAILVYEFNDEDKFKYFGNNMEKGLNLNNDAETWKNVVNYYRNGRKKDKCNKNIQSMLDDTPFIFGPMSAGLDNRGRPLGHGRSERKQLCILDTDLAMAFNSHLVLAIFL